MRATSECTTADVLLAPYRVPLTPGIEVEACTPCGAATDGGIAIEVVEVDLDYPYEPGDSGYDAEIDALVGGASGYFLPFGLTLAPEGCATAGLVSILPSHLLVAIAEEPGCTTVPLVIVATLRAAGDRDGEHVGSEAFELPIYVCCGCLTYGVDPPLSCDDPPPDDLYAGDPKSGLPICEPVTCCWDEVDYTDRLLCPHPAALGE